MSPRTRSFFVALLCLLLFSSLTWSLVLAQDAPLPFSDYRSESWYLPQSPAVTGGPVGALFNPASWSITDRAGADFWWNDHSLKSGLDNYGLAVGRNLGFALNATTLGATGDTYRIYDYQLGMSQGGRVGSFGLAYRWSGGETNRSPRHKALSVGFINRRSRFASFGASGTKSLESADAQYIFDLGLRPLGRSWLSIFADYTINNDQSFFQDGSWGLGLELRPVKGLHLGLRARQQLARDDWDYSLMAGITLNDFHAAIMPGYDPSGNLGTTSYLLRTAPPFSGRRVHNPLKRAARPTYYPISLENKVLTYQKYRYLDDKRVAWLDLLQVLQRIEAEDSIQGLVLNLAGFDGRPSLIWEFRQQLQALQKAGKRVVIHADRLNQRTYYLASVADRLNLDPWGHLNLPGLTLSRSYLKGTLEKVGVGFQEQRYFKYKSAAETLSRDSMSDADREQRQRVVDVIYEQLSQDITDSRGLEPGGFDQAVDELGMLTTAEAQARELIDGSGRWEDLIAWLKTSEKAQLATADALPAPVRHYDDNWGPALRIPVVYTVGPCEMDSGIKGRSTGAYLRRLARDPQVAAVVLRADSPGGDPLPSDLVAEGIRQLKKAGKPVIVSQGDVAASGGYWISMDGSKILTTPMTITGSIGVISGWVWDKGVAEKLGVSSDAVSRGRHADLYSQVRLPLLGSLPRRPMNQEEMDRAEFLIRGMYDDFLKAVSVGRGMDKEKVHEVAQGRVWMGGDAIERGLCDQFGSLADALKMAREMAGIPQWKPVEIVEYPARKMFQFPRLLPALPSFGGWHLDLSSRLESGLARFFNPPAGEVEMDENQLPGLGLLDTDYIRKLSRSPGKAQLLVSPESLPEGWKDWR